MDPLDQNYVVLLRKFKKIELPDNAETLNSCIWWIKRLNRVKEEKRLRNILMQKIMNDLKEGCLSEIFSQSQNINFVEPEIPEDIGNGDAHNFYEKLDQLEKQKIVIEKQNKFIKIWLPGYLTLLGELIKQSCAKEEILKVLDQYDIQDFDDFKQTKPSTKKLVNDIWLYSIDTYQPKTNTESSKKLVHEEKFEKKYQYLKNQFKKLSKSVIHLQNKNKTVNLKQHEQILEIVPHKQMNHFKLEEMANELEIKYKNILDIEILK